MHQEQHTLSKIQTCIDDVPDVIRECAARAGPNHVSTGEDMEPDTFYARVRALLRRVVQGRLIVASSDKRRLALYLHQKSNARPPIPICLPRDWSGVRRTAR